VNILIGNMPSFQSQIYQYLYICSAFTSFPVPLFIMRMDLFTIFTGNNGNSRIALRTMGLVFGLVILFSACRKESESSPCAGNCGIVQLEGTIYDQSTNLPLSGQSISVTLNQNQFCLPCSSYKLASGMSDNNGHFQLSYSLDTNLLKEYHIIVSVPTPSNYILFPVLKDSFNSKALQPAYTRNFGYTNMDSMQNLKFGFYSIAPLQVNLHRVSAIVQEAPALFLYANIDGSNIMSSLPITQTAANKDTTLVINTSANLLTRISWNKYITTTTLQSGSGSIKCTPGGNNVLDINY
jgi:hypothetical protein